MRENKVRSVWQAGGAVVNGWLHIPDSFAAEVMAHQGWDSLTIDLQHGPVDYQASLGMLQAISTTDTTPLARVSWNEPGIIMKMLDAGCIGIICPMVSTRQEVEAFVGACRYPPHGYRSFGPTRATLYGGPDYAEKANDTVVTIAMIETAGAVEGLDDILSVPGLDAVYIGPADLSQNLGAPPRGDVTEPRLVAVIERILSAARRHGVVAGIHTMSTEYALRMIEQGFQFVTVHSDARLLAAAAAHTLSEMKRGKGSSPASTGLY